jgi:hypothetical protein
MNTLLTSEEILDQLEQERAFIEEDDANNFLFFNDPVKEYNGSNGEDEDITDCYNFSMHITDYPESVWL